MRINFTIASEFFLAEHHFLCVLPPSITSAMTLVLLIAAYKDLQSREDTRNGAWQQEGWDEVVYYTGEDWRFKQLWVNHWSIWDALWAWRTLRLVLRHIAYIASLCCPPVPLIQHMDSRIMIPTKASPLQWSETPRVRGRPAGPFLMRPSTKNWAACLHNPPHTCYYKRWQDNRGCNKVCLGSMFWMILATCHLGLRCTYTLQDESSWPICYNKIGL